MDKMGDPRDVPELPSGQHLRVEAGAMERTISQDMREERQDLREAAEQTLNVIMDLTLGGVVKWMSSSWSDVVGTDPATVTGKPIEDLLLDENKEAFKKAVESMAKDDTRSQIIRFKVAFGPTSKLLPSPQLETTDDNAHVVERIQREGDFGTIDLEGQGIMVYDRSSGGESHVSDRKPPRPYCRTNIPADYVDDKAVGRTTPDQDRFTRHCCRGPWLRSRDSC